MINLDHKQTKTVETVSYNSRDCNASKKLYLDHLLHDIVHLQVHWLSDSQVNDLLAS